MTRHGGTADGPDSPACGCAARLAPHPERELLSTRQFLAHFFNSARAGSYGPALAPKGHNETFTGKGGVMTGSTKALRGRATTSARKIVILATKAAPKAIAKAKG